MSTNPTVYEIVGRLDAGSLDVLGADAVVARDGEDLLILEPASNEGGEA